MVSLTRCCETFWKKQEQKSFWELAKENEHNSQQTRKNVRDEKARTWMETKNCRIVSSIITRTDIKKISVKARDFFPGSCLFSPSQKDSTEVRSSFVEALVVSLLLHIADKSWRNLCSSKELLDTSANCSFRKWPMRKKQYLMQRIFEARMGALLVLPQLLFIPNSWRVKYTYLLALVGCRRMLTGLRQRLP